MTQLLIFPYGGNGIEALDCAEGQFEVIGFIDDNEKKHGISPYGVPVFGRDSIKKYPQAKVLAVPGSPKSFHQRDQVIEGLEIDEDRFTSVFHPSVILSNHCRVGKNVLIMGGCVITSNAIIEDHVCLLPGSVIHHDSKIGRFSMIGSGVCVAGNTTIGELCYIGSGSNIINGITIEDRALIGMGSNVIRPVARNSKVAGNPARKL